MDDSNKFRNLTSIEKIEYLVKKINDKRDPNRARHLIRVLSRPQNNTVELRKALSNSDNPFLKGIAVTLEYLTLSEEEKRRFEFNEDYSGWGLYEQIETGLHSGNYALWFAKIGGDAILSGYRSGHGCEFRDRSKSDGTESGWYSYFRNHSQASGWKSGWYSEFEDQAEPTGVLSGWYPRYGFLSSESAPYPTSSNLPPIPCAPSSINLERLFGII